MVYMAVATILGIALTLVPLIVLAEFRSGISHEGLNTIPEQFKSLERKGAYKDAEREFTFLSLSFAVSLVAYVFIKRRRAEHEYRVAPPYLF